MNGLKTPHSLAWNTLHNEPLATQLAMFRQASAQINAQDVKSGFRAFATDLLARGLIDMSDYVAIFGGKALHYLTPNATGSFCDMRTGADATTLAGIYSRAKYGGVSEIRYLARCVIDYLAAELDDTSSSWSGLFCQAKEEGESVVMMTTGWRNVPSTANVLYDIVVEEINLTLAHKGLPTIINVKLPRIAPPCENYASLSQAERDRVNLVQDHVIPAENFYRWSGVHVIFGDDVLVTGATADKVLYESLCNGARSFRAIYPVALDPQLALTDASVEDRLNSVSVKQHLDENVAQLLSAPGYQPILRALRLLFGEDNRDSLPAFLPNVPALTWLNLYKSALNNEFLAQPACAPSLVMLRTYLMQNGLLCAKGKVLVK
ncbi:hypothetical protein COO59_12520 [Mixta theicola]|uniref:Phosphoribosyl transferase-like protein n=1 Tax=Mixta theicola TaxID=1458355 RepID=A0A2K1Q8U0_9GAMM|nr:hypothetical protein [Mixta theicola]PNS11443.1 hypothetical protein COO59_12520 [Mixta theicola]GLR10400.1 hypothetical protein GCM10007905_31200 [Mixta theicola]